MAISYLPPVAWSWTITGDSVPTCITTLPHNWGITDMICIDFLIGVVKRKAIRWRTYVHNKHLLASPPSCLPSNNIKVLIFKVPYVLLRLQRLSLPESIKLIRVFSKGNALYKQTSWPISAMAANLRKSARNPNSTFSPTLLSNPGPHSQYQRGTANHKMTIKIPAKWISMQRCIITR